ncbi:MAG: HD domain-containing protein [Lachnospiraceae bacterium]|nr:HD domain-containing protein [Lachnospiraceae bacterium]
MMELIKAHQLNLMLVLCGACGILVFLLLNTRFLSKSRKLILIAMETMAVFLLWFDRLAYIYAGDPSQKGYLMVRLSNCIVFFLTPGIVLGFNKYLMDWLTHEGGMTKIPVRLSVIDIACIAGMILAVISAFTGLYYYFDASNVYQRGNGFLIAYIIPVICPLMQFAVILQYRKIFSRLIYISLIMYIFVPLICGIIQIAAYGISIVNMAMVAVSISLYISTYLDINNTVEHAHEIEIRNIQGERERMQRLFDQTATAFVSAVENKDDFTRGNSVRIAEYAKRVAKAAGKSDEECEKVYYAALLHDVGLIGVPDSVIKNDADPTKQDFEIMRKKPVIGAQILSSITEYPYLSQGARYSHERYNGSGYPEGLKGEQIPEIARMIAVADAYVTMTTKKRYRDAHPDFMAREAFVKGAGEKFDPVFADIMVRIIDEDSGKNARENAPQLETELTCEKYRETVSTGIAIEQEEKKISFDCELKGEGENRFSAPAIILFDSYDSRIHKDKKTIGAYHYLEYGEIWFDDHSITTAARKIEERIISKADKSGGDKKSISCTVTAKRFEDHVRLVMKAGGFEKEVIMALPDISKSAYIGITGENCRISGIKTKATGKSAGPDDIPRIAKQISYTDHMEGDFKNLNIDRTRSASTDGIEIKDRLRLAFHTMSLPGASLVWHCPYIVLFGSSDGTVNGEDYREYAFIKLNGEHNGSNDHAVNRFVMKKSDDFPGWEAWKEKNREGIECEISLRRKKNSIVLKTRTLGISIENTTTLIDEKAKVYIALTGDQVALTDIRIV